MDVQDIYDDVIELNVGGKIMATKRSTLCQVECSFLASMFGGSWNGTKMARDKDGRVFLDFNPKHFTVILGYLREKAFTNSEVPIAVSKIASEEVEKFNKLVDYLGLVEMRLAKFPTTEAFEFHGSGARLEDNGAVVVVSTIKSRDRFAVGQNIYERGVFRIKLNLQGTSFRDFFCEIRIGVIVEKLENDRKTDFSSPVFCYGWGLLKSQLKEYSNKIVEAQSHHGFLPSFETIELVLDCDAAKLYLNTKNGKQYYVDLPKWVKYRLMIKVDEQIISRIRIDDFRKEL